MSPTKAIIHIALRHAS